MNNRELRVKYGDCPENENYTYPPHFFATKDGFTMHITNWDSFLEKYKGLPDLLFLEIGTGNGRSGVWMLENILTHDTSKLITIDIQENWFYKKGTKYKNIEFEEDVLIKVRENFEPYKNKCDFILSDSKRFLKSYNGPKFDFIYIDGCHDPDHVMYESALCFDILKTGGFMLFDDYDWGTCRFGIESFLLSYNTKYRLLFKAWQVLVEKL